MRPLALLLAGALIAAPATAGRIELDEDEQRTCDREGGCHIVTTQVLRNLFRDAFESGAKSCSNRT